MPRSHFYAAGVVAFGALFPLAAQAVTFTTLYTFPNYTDGVFPQNLAYQGGKLYGDTVYGGYENCDTNYIGCGLVFQLDLASGVESTVYTFESTDNGRKFPHGGYPYGNIVDLHGKLYGTAGRGPHNEGVTFQVNIAKQTQKVLKTSTGSAVEGPDYLVEASGALFGTGERRHKRQRTAVHRRSRNGYRKHGLSVYRRRRWQPSSRPHHAIRHLVRRRFRQRRHELPRRRVQFDLFLQSIGGCVHRYIHFPERCTRADTISHGRDYAFRHHTRRFCAILVIRDQSKQRSRGSSGTASNRMPTPTRSCSITIAFTGRNMGTAGVSTAMCSSSILRPAT